MLKITTDLVFDILHKREEKKGEKRKKKIFIKTTIYIYLSLTRLQLSGTDSLFLSAILPLSALLNLP